MSLEAEIKKLFDLKCEIDKSIRKLRTTSTVILGLFAGAILYSIITLTAVQRRQIEKVIPELQEVKDNYASVQLVINISKSYSLQLKKAAAIAAKDSSALLQVEQEYENLRLEWYKDMKSVRGGGSAQGSGGLQ
jgi:molybdopterin-binding protein